MTDATPGPGRPRKRAPEEQVGRRYAEAHRLEELRDEAQAVWERERTMAAKASVCAAEMRAASAWASALRADGKQEDSFRHTKAAQDWAAAHDKAITQLTADRVEELHRRVVRREAARAAAEARDDDST